MASIVASAPEQAHDAAAARLHGEVGRRSPSLRSWLLAGSWVVVATCLQLARSPVHRATDVLWAEDGLFVSQALHHPLLDRLPTPHAGYLQVIPRLIAQPAAHLPLSWAAPWMAASAAAVVALLAIVVYDRAGRVLRTPVARAAAAVMLPFLAQTAFEVSAVVNDLHWYVAYAAWWLLLAPPGRRAGQVAAAGLVALAGLSDPLTVLLLPAAAVGLLRARRDRSLRLPALPWLAPLALLVALALQAFAHATAAQGGRLSPTSLRELGVGYAVRVGLSALTGDRLLLSVFPAAGAGLAGAVVVALVVALLVAFVRTTGSARAVALLAVGTSAAYWAVSLGVRGSAGVADRAGFTLGGSRYTVVPLLLLWVAVLVLVDRAGSTLPVALVAGFLAVQSLTDWSQVTVRSGGPSWATAVRTATAQCRAPGATHGPQLPVLVADHFARFDGRVSPGPDEVVIAVAPLPPPGQPPLFGVIVPCGRLR